MPEFSYTARDRGGRRIEGTIQAQNSAIALGRVREMGYEVEKVRAVEYIAPPKASIGRRFAENFIFPVSSGVPLTALAVFYRQLATLINAGMPLYQSLLTLEAQTRNKHLQGILRNCQQQVMMGGKLSDVFNAYPWVFNELQIEMLRAGEHGGMFDQMLTRIADYLDREIALRRLISRLTIYPKLVCLSALFILGKDFFKDGIPAFSKMILGSMGKSEYTIMNYLNETLFTLLWGALIVFGIVAFCRIFLFQSEGAREGYERFKMGVPGLGKVIKQFALAKFGHAFGAMYAGGMPLQTAIRVAGNASGSKMVARATRRALIATERGAPISQAFRETGVFPNLVVDMLHTGEQTGNVDQMMEKVAEYLEGEAETKAHMYSHIFATAIYLTVAILVGIAVIRFWSGMGAGSLGGQEGKDIMGDLQQKTLDHSNQLKGAMEE
jgi:type II secretory pathway component PulF